MKFNALDVINRFNNNFGFAGQVSGVSGFSGGSGYSGYSGESASKSGYSGYSGVSGYSGYSGHSGVFGADGVFGGDSNLFSFDTSILVNPPVGDLRLNHANPTLATEMYVSVINNTSVDVSVWLAALSNSNSSPLGRIRLFSEFDYGNFYTYNITAPVVDNGTYFTVPIGFVVGTGALTLNELVVISFSATGQSGYSGYSGSGVSGFSGISGYSGAIGGFAIDFIFDSTVNGAPADGYITYNDATPSLTTILNVSHKDSLGNDVDGFLDSLVIGDVIRVYDSNNLSIFHFFRIIGAHTNIPVIPPYDTLPVVYISGSGIIPNSTPISFSTALKGDKGDSGYSGFSGSGISGYSGVGTSGYSGYSGTSGFSGISGYSGTPAQAGVAACGEMYIDDNTVPQILTTQNIFYKVVDTWQAGENHGFALDIPNDQLICNEGGVFQAQYTVSFVSANVMDFIFVLAVNGVHLEKTECYITSAGTTTQVSAVGVGLLNLAPTDIISLWATCETDNLEQITVRHASLNLASVAGTSGFSGTSGYSGFSGSGISGFSGFSGSGISGYSGFSGIATSGYSGYSGVSGYSGYSGISGYSGFSGKSGYSGFSGSGISGYSGYSGSGISGYSGYSGYSGSGVSGYSGYSGSGVSGYSGSGVSGYSGFSGSGVSGYSGYSGSGVSGYSGTNGVVGTSGFSGFSGSGISGYSGSGISGYSGFSGTNGTGVSGFSGYSGTNGSVGTSGFSGFSGANGTGTSGFSGFSGSGISGYSGFSGANGIGTSGFSGYSGVNGVGTSGFSGFSGTNGTGTSGFSGYSGTNGSVGTSGFSGFSGTNGTIGTSGFSGFSGATGAGTSGFSGYSGINGAGTSGFSGYSGTNGTIGTSGFSGFSGTNGTIGTSGFSGYSGSGISGYSGQEGNIGGYISQWNYNSNTTIASVAAGEVRLNNADLTLVTQVGINVVDSATTNQLTSLTNWLKANRSRISFTDDTNGRIGDNVNYFVTGVTNNTTWFLLDVTLISNMGVFVNADLLDLGIVNDGVSGFSGYSGSGVSGYSGYSGSGISGYSGFSGVNGTGTSGFSGYSGINGTVGTSGFSGFSGTNGTVGTSGFSGFSGTSGYSGFSGSGISGYSGFSGSGISGYSGYSGSGISGYSGFSGTNGTGTSGFSGYSGSGISGYSGFSGTNGTGTSGFSGYSGTNGTGTSGFSGFSGTNGTGTSGFSGYSGTNGTGTSGFSGFSGTNGVGTSGFSGYSGSGISGYSGFSGTNGTGTSGFSGYSGTNGVGTSGFSGFSGTNGTGTSGFSGYSGTNGSIGTSGFSGYSGVDGTVGTSGFSGYSGATGAGTSGFSGYSGATSTSGFSGYSGLEGYPAGFISEWLYDSNTTIASVGAGGVRFNNATISASTQIGISATDNLAVNQLSVLTAYLAANRSRIIFSDDTDGRMGNFVSFLVTSIVNNTTWIQLNVTLITNKGTILNADLLDLGIVNDGVSGYSGSNGATLSRFYYPDIKSASIMTSPAQGTHSINFMSAPFNLSASRFDVPVSISLATIGNANTAALVLSQWMGIYTRNGNTLSSLTTASTQTTWTWASNSASYSSITGARLFSVPVNINMSAGEYYVAYGLSTNSSSIGTATTNLGVTLSIFGGLTGNTLVANAMDIGVNSATSINLFSGHGVYSQQSAGNFTGISISGINQTGINLTKANFAFLMRNL